MSGNGRPFKGGAKMLQPPPPTRCVRDSSWNYYLYKFGKGTNTFFVE